MRILGRGAIAITLSPRSKPCEKERRDEKEEVDLNIEGAIMSPSPL
jgi:hypothetical protein